VIKNPTFTVGISMMSVIVPKIFVLPVWSAILLVSNIRPV